ncbi:MAG: TonB-dependent receptor, partial [Labilithrix sp.]|nr:TonB-dependent receptor [Labilithrix sp.]
GGAVNIVTDHRYDNRLSSSYQVGSFGTHRLTVDGRYRHDDTGFVAGATAFADFARNNYPIDVMVTDAQGTLSPARVRRFHDAYRAYGARVETGFVDRPWARRLLLQGFASTFHKELQNNVVMTTPYGEPTYGETVYGATARYEQPLGEKLELEAVANYSHRVIDFVDQSRWLYDWFGARKRLKQRGGEIDSNATDRTFWQNSGFGRVLLTWNVANGHALRASTTPSVTSRKGEERLLTPGAADALAAPRTLFTVVSGVEYESNLWGDRLQNIVFAKNYVYHASGDVLSATRTFLERSRDELAFGGGDALRYRFSRALYAKVSYEYATRLPRADEVFGNGVLVQENLEIVPEVSHNGNVGPRLELRKTKAGDFTVDINAFLRESSQLIVLLGTDRSFRYENIYGARSLGVENALGWTSPGRLVSIDGMLTWQDLRNTAREGTFGAFEGDRIPNRPYLFGSWGARLRIPNVVAKADAIEPFYHGRYVHSFYRGWESQGQREYKQVVDSQLTHDVGLSWTLERSVARITSTFEVDNVTNARVYDFFGVQRPGRAFFIKVTGEI